MKENQVATLVYPFLLASIETRRDVSNNDNFRNIPLENRCICVQAIDI